MRQLAAPERKTKNFKAALLAVVTEYSRYFDLFVWIFSKFRILNFYNKFKMR